VLCAECDVSEPGTVSVLRGKGGGGGGAYSVGPRV
jgi:hypothetical protein